MKSSARNIPTGTTPVRFGLGTRVVTPTIISKAIAEPGLETGSRVSDLIRTPDVMVGSND